MISQLKDLLQWTQHDSVLTITLLSSHSDSENITYTGVEVWCTQTQGGARQKLNEPAPRLEKQKKMRKQKDTVVLQWLAAPCLHASVYTPQVKTGQKKSETVSNREWVCVLGGDTFGWDLGVAHSPSKKDLQSERGVSNLTLSERAAHL